MSTGRDLTPFASIFMLRSVFVPAPVRLEHCNGIWHWSCFLTFRSAAGIYSMNAGWSLEDFPLGKYTHWLIQIWTRWRRSLLSIRVQRR